MFLIILLFIAACFLAYSNGANDNFKGVATLFGSKTTTYRQAIRLATITTLLGSVSSIFLAKTLVKSFTGKGLVPDFVASSPDFSAAVAFGAGTTVLLAAIRGIPISTTHSLTGALVGSGIMAVGMDVNFSVLGSKFFLPLIASPFIALLLSTIVYKTAKTVKERTNLSQEMCVCIGETGELVPLAETGGVLAFGNVPAPGIIVDIPENCVNRYTGSFAGIGIQSILDRAHFLSAGIVSFARGLNDTPKIMALMLAVSFLDIHYGLAVIAIGIALGGLLNARKVAETMSNKITPMTRGQGFVANIVTGFLVVVASKFGVPVSTTHVSVGSIFGIGIVSNKGNRTVMSGILVSWILTLPAAALLSAGFYAVLTNLN